MRAIASARRRSAARRAPAVEPIAAVAHRFAVLLAAGVAPGSALGHLAESGADNGSSAERVVRASARAVAGGTPVAEAFAAASARCLPAEREAWAALADAWTVAARSGAPLADCLRAIAGSLRELARLRRELEVALAGPRATARLVSALPLVAVLFGTLLGFNTLEVMLLSPLGVAAVAVGVGLLLAGRRWNARLIAEAGRGEAAPGLGIDLVAIAMSGGASPDRARAIVAETGRDDAGVAEVLALSARAGVPAVELLRSEAEQRRREARSAGQERAASVAVLLMLPLAVCVLPAFLLLGVVPLLLAVVTSTLGGIT